MAKKAKAKVRETRDKAKKKVVAAKKKAYREIKKAQKKMQNTHKKVETFIKKNPEKAAAVSAGVGAALGAISALLIAKRPKKKNSASLKATQNKRKK